MANNCWSTFDKRTFKRNLLSDSISERLLTLSLSVIRKDISFIICSLTISISILIFKLKYHTWVYRSSLRITATVTTTKTCSSISHQSR